MRELTLDELIKSNGSSSEEGAIFNNNDMEKVSLNDVANAIGVESNNVGDDIVNPEIVENAFAGLANVIEKKKKMADEMYEKAEELAEELEFENELREEDGNEDTYELQDDNTDNTPVINTSAADRASEIIENIDEDDLNENEKEYYYDGENEEESDDNENDKETIAEYERSYPLKTITAANNKKEKISDDSEFEPSTLDSLMDDINAENPDDEDMLDDETSEERIEKFRKSIESIKITSNPINLAEFKIRKKPISTSKILDNLTGAVTKKRFDWALCGSKRSITLEECDGTELEALRKSINGSNSTNAVVLSLKFIYNHIVDNNKLPFEEWTKTIHTEDVESLYFAQYAACYSDSNILPRKDEKTGKTALVETSIYDMVKYKDDAAKEELMNLRGKDTTTKSKSIEGTMIQISDDFVITYLPATLYSTFIQFSSLSNKIIDKYGELLNTMAYIDGFFKIDRENNDLVPIMIKEYPNDINKTILSKIKAYITVLKTLTADQYNILMGKLSNIINEPKVTYVQPKVEHEGVEYPEDGSESMLTLLFTRAQLAQLKSL